MRGAASRSIKRLAGHSELGTTPRYMHLSEQALDDAIRLLNGRERGNSEETARATVEHLRLAWQPWLTLSDNRERRLAVRQGFEPWVQL